MLNAFKPVVDQAAQEAQGLCDALATLNKEPPWSDEAEKGVLSGLLHDLDLIDDTMQILSDASFYHFANREIYRILCHHRQNDIPLDIGILTQTLRDKGLLEKIGGAGAISELYVFLPIAAHFAFYRQQVLEKHLLRRMITESVKNIQRANAHGASSIDEDVHAILDDAEERLRAVRDGNNAGHIEGAAMQIAAAVDAINDRIAQHSHLELSDDPGAVIPGLSTGLHMLDDMTNGFCGGHVWVVSGDVGDAKTALASQFCAHLAGERQPVCYYLTEDSSVDWWTRLIAHVTHIDLTRLLRGQLSREEQAMVAKATAAMQKWPIVLRHVPDLTDVGLISDMRWQLRHNKTRLFVIDYLQNIELTLKVGMREDQAIVSLMKKIGIVTSRSKTSATTLVLSQVNETGRLAGAKGISRVANVIFRIRPPVEDGAKVNPMQPELARRDHSKRELHFGKARMTSARGKTLMLAFNGATQCFTQ